MNEVLLKYKTRESCRVDTVDIIYPKFQLRSRESDNLARKYYSTTLKLYNDKESKKSRSKKRLQHIYETLYISNFDVKEYELFFKENNIRIIESFDENVSGNDINNECHKFGIMMPNTHYNSWAYDVIYQKMKRSYYMYEDFKIDFSYNGYSKWHNILRRFDKIGFSDICCRDDGSEFTSLKKLESVKFREDKVLWTKANEILTII